MTIIDDRDLARIEPSLFLDAVSAAINLMSASNADISTNLLTSTTPPFSLTGIDEGHIAVVNGQVLEILDGQAQSIRQVSRIRFSSLDPIIDPVAGTNMQLDVYSFEHLIDVEESSLLSALGINPDHPVNPLDETAIVNVEDVEQILALRTITRAFAIASAGNPTDQSLKDRTAIYRQLAAASRRTPIMLDLDGDGTADAIHRLDVVQMTRQ